MALSKEEFEKIKKERQAAKSEKPSGSAAESLLELEKKFIDKSFSEQVKTATPVIPDEENLLEKMGTFAEEKFLRPATETFVSPFARELIRPFVSVRAGLTGEEEAVETPFGEVKPITELSTGEAIMGAVETGLAAVPVEKVIAKPIQMVSKLFGGVAKRLGGAISGKGAEALEMIIENPEAAKEGLRGESLEVLKDSAKEIRGVVKRMQSDASEKFGQEIDKLPVFKKINKKKIERNIAPRLENFGITMIDNKFNLKNSVLDEADEKVLKKMFDLFETHTDETPKALNDLARKVSAFRKGADRTQLNTVVDTVRRGIRDTVGEEVPQLKKALTDYSQKEDFLDALMGELSIKRGFDSTEGIIKTSRKIANLFGSNKELTRELIEQAGAGDILAREAGRQLAEAPSRASVSIGETTRSILQSVIPPKAIGEVAAALGTTKEKVRPLINILNNYAPVERIALFNLFASLLNEGQERQ